MLQQIDTKQKLATNTIIEEKNPQNELIVAQWLRKNTKHFGRMSLELVKELSQLTFSLPAALGGGVFSRGDVIACKGLQARMIYIVY